jgi:hypothetical protein
MYRLLKWILLQIDKNRDSTSISTAICPKSWSYMTKVSSYRSAPVSYMTRVIQGLDELVLDLIKVWTEWPLQENQSLYNQNDLFHQWPKFHKTEWPSQNTQIWHMVTGYNKLTKVHHTSPDYNIQWPQTKISYITSSSGYNHTYQHNKLRSNILQTDRS